MVKDNSLYIVRQTKRFRVIAWTKKEALEKAQNEIDSELLTEVWN